MAGCNPKIQALYPPIEYPVSTETRGLSHMIEWAHLEKWFVVMIFTYFLLKQKTIIKEKYDCMYLNSYRSLPLERDSNRRISGAATYGFSLHDDEFNFLNGNIHEGKAEPPNK